MQSENHPRWTIAQIIDRLAWWARNCGDQCPAAEAMEQAVKRLENLYGVKKTDCERPSSAAESGTFPL